MKGKQIVTSIDAAIYTLTQLKKAAEDGLFWWNRNNIVRECRNLRDFSNQLWADWLTAAAAEAEQAERTRTELRL